MKRTTVIQYLSDIIGCVCLFGSFYAALWAAPILDAIFSN
jgi:hypothetical protein